MEIKEKLKSIKKPLEFNYSVENIINFSKILRETLLRLPKEKINRILKIFIEKILVYPDRCEIFYTFDLEIISFNKNLSDNSNNKTLLNKNILNRDSESLKKKLMDLYE